MERLCDEILQLIFHDLEDPTPLTLVSQRFYRFSQDPYVRALYFLNHYGPVEAMYYALGRGRLLSEKVFDILLSSGAQCSRYLVQIAIHHYFHTQAHFIKTPWVRSVPLRVFLYFLTIAEERYGEIPRGRGDDDGTLFTIFLKESRLSAQRKSVSWDTIRDLLEKYKFVPFCHRDPITPQFPLALAVEPRLLPYAVANGFSMDYKYRDFVFRKMFERPASPNEKRADDVASNVRELLTLTANSAMFVSRTIAAEVCMEAKSNEIGYKALKQLDKSGDLRFELSLLVEALLKTFLTTRSICSISTGEVLLHLFSDYPSSDVTVRLVVLIVVFIAAEASNMSTASIRTKLETLGLMPITKRDAFNILVNPFVEKFQSLLNFAREDIGVKEDGSRGMDSEELTKFVESVGVRCVEISCKGNLIKRLCANFPTVRNAINTSILAKHQINACDLPKSEDPVFSAALSKDYLTFGPGDVYPPDGLKPEVDCARDMDIDDDFLQTTAANEVIHASIAVDAKRSTDGEELGNITQETLTSMLRHDEAIPIRSRRRSIFNFSALDLTGRMRYPHDALPVAKWAKTQYGSRSPAVAVFMTHAVLNGNSTILHDYLHWSDDPVSLDSSSYVPVTLKHFKLLAQLGRTPSYYLWKRIEDGAEFYSDENDYLSEAAQATVESARQRYVKTDAVQSCILSSPAPVLQSSSPVASLNGRGRKRPRRSVVSAVKSYVVPDSDEETIDDEPVKVIRERSRAKETNLQLWIRHLGELWKSEKRKEKEMKKELQTHAQMEEGSRLEVALKLYKNDFIKSLNVILRSLRKVEAQNRLNNPCPELAEEFYEEESDEFTPRPSRRRRGAATL